MALGNCCSIKNKDLYIADYQIEIGILTVTWLKNNDTGTLLG